MNIYVDENKIKQISFMSKPNGVTQPVELLDKEGNFLDGFKIHTKRSYQEKTAVPKNEIKKQIILDYLFIKIKVINVLSLISPFFANNSI